jgi:hypothetical protein
MVEFFYRKQALLVVMEADKSGKKWSRVVKSLPTILATIPVHKVFFYRRGEIQYLVYLH